jgi:hypothetical protein
MQLNGHNYRLLIGSVVAAGRLCGCEADSSAGELSCNARRACFKWHTGGQGLTVQCSSWSAAVVLVFGQPMQWALSSAFTLHGLHISQILHGGLQLLAAFAGCVMGCQRLQCTRHSMMLFIPP